MTAGSQLAHRDRPAPSLAVRLLMSEAKTKNRQRLERIREALARLSEDLEDGRRRKGGCLGETREERALVEVARIRADLDRLEIF